MKEKKKKKLEKMSLKDKMSKSFDIPQEVISDVPVIRLVGNKEISIENFIGLIEYTTQKIRLSSRCGMLIIDGVSLEAKQMSEEQIIIRGTILQVAFAV